MWAYNELINVKHFSEYLVPGEYTIKVHYQYYHLVNIVDILLEETQDDKWVLTLNLLFCSFKIYLTWLFYCILGRGYQCNTCYIGTLEDLVHKYQ